MKKLFLLPKLTVVLLSIFFIANGCKNKTSENDNLIDINPTDEKNEIAKEVTGYPIPTSIEITQMLNKAGAAYILDLTNQVENIENYVTQASKSLNLGIYGADLSYAVTYGQTQETMDLLKVSKKLLDELNISSPFNDSLEIRVENNLDNTDSLISIISDSFLHTYEYLQDNEQDLLSIMVITGSWIESIFLSSQIAMLTENNADILKIISNQESSLTKLIEIIDPIKENKDVVDLYKELLVLNEIYTKVEGTITQEQFDILNTKISEIRKSIVL